MTNAWFLGAAASVPQHESEVRSTVEPVRTDSVTAEMQHAPDWNELDTDESGQLVGLSPRVAGADTTDTVKYPPWWAGAASEPHNIVIDRQVSTSGTAARREEAGEQGHGTMQYAESIDPLIRDGAAFGNTYFLSHDRTIQESMGEYMSPPDQDNWASKVVASRAAKESRDAFMSTQYAAFLGG